MPESKTIEIDEIIPPSPADDPAEKSADASTSQFDDNLNDASAGASRRKSKQSSQSIPGITWKSNFWLKCFEQFLKIKKSKFSGLIIFVGVVLFLVLLLPLLVILFAYLILRSIVMSYANMFRR